MAKTLAANGPVAKIADVHIECIESIESPRRYERTNTPIESGSPVTSHRLREPFVLRVAILVSDAEPIVGASLIGLWESDHASKTRDRLFALQESGALVTFFDGRKFYRAPNGSRVWTIDEIDDRQTPDLSGAPGAATAWRAVITLGETATFSTEFTSVDADLDPTLYDSTDGTIDKGQQSTEAVPSDQAASIPG